MKIQYTYLNKDAQLEKLWKAKQFLKKYDIPFIQTNSLDHIKRLYFVQNTHYPLYIVDESTSSAVGLRERMELFNQQEHILLMDRLYVSPERQEKTQ